MKKQVILLTITLLILIVLMAIPVYAQTITMANPDSSGERDIAVYYFNGTMQGFYNTTSIITLDNKTDYIFTLKPQTNSFIDEPTSWLTNRAFPYVKTNFVAILIMFAVAAVLLGRR